MGNCLPHLGHGEKNSTTKVPKIDMHGSSKIQPIDPEQTASCGEPFKKKHVGDPEGERGIVRVKIVLTKAEVARLLAECHGTTEKIFEHVARQLEKSKAGTGGGNMTLSVAESCCDTWRPSLESIPEDF